MCVCVCVCVCVEGVYLGDMKSKFKPQLPPTVAATQTHTVCTHTHSWPIPFKVPLVASFSLSLKLLSDCLSCRFLFLIRQHEAPSAL